MRGYFRLREDRDPDAYLLALAVDALPPVVFNLAPAAGPPRRADLVHAGRAGARRPAGGHASQDVGGGWFDEESVVWTRPAPGRAEPPDRPGRPRRADYGTLLIFQTNADAAIATTVVPPYSSG
jgi:hypothetical protein